MSAQPVGLYDPAMTAYMTETMELYRGVFRVANQTTLLADGTARIAAISRGYGALGELEGA